MPRAETATCKGYLQVRLESGREVSRKLRNSRLEANLAAGYRVRKSVTIDWTLRESARARIRVIVKRILNKYGYPPDLQAEAVKTVLAQAELLYGEWV